MQKQSATQDKKKSAKNQSQSQSESQSFDPVCGMDVDLNSSETEKIERNGKTYYFCSSECREQFEASPDDFDA